MKCHVLREREREGGRQKEGGCYELGTEHALFHITLPCTHTHTRTPAHTTPHRGKAKQDTHNTHTTAPHTHTHTRTRAHTHTQRVCQACTHTHTHTVTHTGTTLCCHSAETC